MHVNNRKQYYLNSFTWKFDKEEKDTPLLKGERVIAFEDPISRTICVKFMMEKS